MIVNLYLQEVMNVDKTVQGMCATVAQAIASAGAGKKEYYTLVKARGNPSVWLTVLRTLKERDQRRGHPNMKAVATAIDALLRSRDWHVLSQYLLYLLVDHIDLSSGVEEEEADELTDELADDLELEFI